MKSLWWRRGAVILWLLGWRNAAGLPVQLPAADQLRAELQAHARPDTARVKRLSALALVLRNNAPEESASLFRAALALAQQLGYPAGMAEARLGLGFYHRHRSEYGLAQAYSEQANRDFAQTGNRQGQTRSLYNLTCIFLDQGQLAKSLQTNLAGLALADAGHDRKWQAFLNTQLGTTSTHLGEYARARHYLREGLRWAVASGDQPSVGHAYAGIGDLYRAQGQWAEAQRNYEKDAASYRRMRDEGGILYEDINIGDMLERQGQVPQALAVGRRSLARASRLQKLGEITRAQLLLARAYLHAGQPDSAFWYGQPSLLAAQRSGAKSISRDASQVLARASARRGRFDAAYRYEQLFGAYRDSLNTSDQQRRVAVVTYRGELARKQAQISLLTRNERLMRAKNRQQRWFLLGALLGLAAVAGLSWGLWRNICRRRSAYALLRQQQDELRATQAQLVQSEKMAFLGELTAGIAHELQNPLTFMKSFADVSTGLVEEINGARSGAGLGQDILVGLKQNLQQISQHGQRASSIIKDMLAHSRSGATPRQPTDLNALVAEHLRLAYEGARAANPDFTATLRQDLDPDLGPVSVVAPDLGRVLLNLCTNALYAVRERQQLAAAAGSGEQAAPYEPSVVVSTRRATHGQAVEIGVRDNGTGMPAEVQARVFQPFFTTKPVGEGTGLGLSLSHDIVTQGHGGTLRVESRAGEGTEFVISLPV
ncbi:ATP-binding protein [Hymenobacter sp. UYCo722]|uniref:ATP-binding protein n=1 Tax=Hymenobacter sp. UYCo722 TaxID=3156335 RepID=UPI00339B3597